MPKQDVVIEVLDARMPQASENPVVAELRGQKPCIKVLNKADLADPVITAAWLRYFEASKVGGRVVAIALSSRNPNEARAKIPELCKKLAAHRGGPGKTVRLMIVGIPNVGKSTLINTLMERKVAKTGDEPAVTKAQQLAILKNGMALSDNPGIMWPKIDDEASSYRLALGGAIPDTAMDYEAVALVGAKYFLERYPALVMARYKLKELPASADVLLAEIGKRRGCLRAGGTVDLHKAADVLLHEFRQGALGRISLEAPPRERQPDPSPAPASESSFETPEDA